MILFLKVSCGVIKHYQIIAKERQGQRSAAAVMMTIGKNDTEIKEAKMA